MSQFTPAGSGLPAGGTGIPTPIQIGPNGIVRSSFGSVLSVASSATETILTVTVPVGKVWYLLSVDVSGNNVGTYDILLNATEWARKRTYFGNLSDVFQVGSSQADAFVLNAGDILLIQVTNVRPYAGDFESRIQYIEV